MLLGGALLNNEKRQHSAKVDGKSGSTIIVEAAHRNSRSDRPGLAFPARRSAHPSPRTVHLLTA